MIKKLQKKLQSKTDDNVEIVKSIVHDENFVKSLYISYKELLECADKYTNNKIEIDTIDSLINYSSSDEDDINEEDINELKEDVNKLKEDVNEKSKEDVKETDDFTIVINDDDSDDILDVDLLKTS